ncbi:AAA family ATPase [Christiangramia sabulilitoris]|uniref:AAA family ATPase n=1 Tax=Christiangramia sabulilitoris TaxID=2583991 RepID=A0A550I7A6_9FLAO|nr:AAA family ATPase [Christiangramia sabulilitoris]TRO66853.1 AAA family ATPase [Christiangramia sabulilitoris]
MKILKIAFKNINSLRGDHEIDFTQEPFISSSLFAITGPTGSGKSTLLDVISLALYGKVPRIPGSRPISKTDIEKYGTILTRNQKEAIARVTYECKYGTFSSQWNISTNRNDKLRDNDMEIYDHQKQALITDKKSEVPDKNEELIGLSYDQFIKAAMLAQGEFAQFLKVTKKERGALLEKITGTGIYRSIGQKVYEMNGLLNKDIEQQQHEIKILKDNLLADEILEQKKTELKSKTEAQEKHQKEIEKLKKSLDLKKEVRKKTTAITFSKEEWDVAENKLKAFDSDHGAPLKLHEKVQDVSEDLRNWNLLNREIINLKSELSGVRESLNTNLESTTSLIAKVSEFIHIETSSTDLSQNLTDFRNKILELQEKRNEKRADYRLEKARFDAELNATGLSLNDSNPDHARIEITEQIEKIEKSIKTWNEEFKVIDSDEIEKLRNTIQREYKITREATRQYAVIEEKHKDLKRNTADHEKLQPQLRSLPPEIEKHRSQVKLVKTRLENLNLKRENQLLKASLEQHRHKLKDGEACPLCGSLQHPYAEHLPEKDDHLYEEIKKVEKQLEDQSGLLNTYVANFSNFKQQAQELEVKNKSLSRNLQELKTAFNEKFSEINNGQNLSEFEDRCDQLENKLEKLSDFEKACKKLQHLKTALPILEKLQSIFQEGRLVREKLDKLYQGKDIQQDVELYQNRWISLESDLKNLKNTREKLKKKLNEKQNQAQKLEKELELVLKEKGFESVKEGYAVLIPDAEVHGLRTERQKIEKTINDARASINLLEGQLEELQKQDPEIKEEALREKLEEQNEQVQIIAGQCKELDRLIKNHEHDLIKMCKLQEQIAEKEKQTRRWRMLNELIGDRTGNKFNDFAQDLTLSRLIKLANVRLKGLSDRYLIDKPADEEDDGLVAIDEHMGGQRRSVKTLSGGETFILSLSMALALSDLASKNVEINSLFIDEGFGTLDPETLDQTLDTLEKLQAESSKTIGIISHVDSLKERISTQIKLTRNGQGYSRLEIS